MATPYVAIYWVGSGLAISFVVTMPQGKLYRFIGFLC